MRGKETRSLLTAIASPRAEDFRIVRPSNPSRPGTSNRTRTYARLGKADKGALRRFFGKTTGVSRAQQTRRVCQYLDTGRIVDRRRGPSSAATPADIGLLADVDAILGQMAGPATREVMRRRVNPLRGRPDVHGARSR